MESFFENKRRFDYDGIIYEMYLRNFLIECLFDNDFKFSAYEIEEILKPLKEKNLEEKKRKLDEVGRKIIKSRKEEKEQEVIARIQGGGAKNNKRPKITSEDMEKEGREKLKQMIGKGKPTVTQDFEFFKKDSEEIDQIFKNVNVEVRNKTYEEITRETITRVQEEREREENNKKPKITSEDMEKGGRKVITEKQNEWVRKEEKRERKKKIIKKIKKIFCLSC